MNQLTLRLEAEAHELIARGHAKLAAARRAATAETPANDSAEWIPAAASPLGKRKTLALARAGAVESSKVGRTVLIRRASLDAFLTSQRRDAANDDEDLFGAA